jgi:glycerol-3-phosphate dehydrogenase
LKLAASDVRSTYSGVRGTVDTGVSDPSKESREHAIWNEDGLLTVTGGKLTTFRLMAREALRATKATLPAAGHVRRTRILDDADGAAALAGLDDATRTHLVGRHGADAPDVVACGGDEAGERIADTNALWAELRWAARTEAVVHLDDLLLRRVRLGLLAEGGGQSLMARIREVAQPELGWDDGKWAAEEKRYRETWDSHYGTRLA